MLYKPDWQETKKRFEAFWQGEILDHCMMAVSVMTDPDKAMVTDPRVWYAPARTEQEVQEYWLSPDVVLKNNLQKFENTLFLGDAVPQVFFNLGTAAHAGFFQGACYQYTNSAWFFPTLAAGQYPAFDPDSDIYKAMRAIGERLTKEGTGKFLVSMPDNTGIIDCLAHLRGTESLLMDFIENRDWVKDCCKVIQNVWDKTTADIYDILAPCNDGGSGIGWLNIWAPGKISQLQCDFSVMISTKDFKEMAVPELEACMEWMDYSLYHLDGVEQVRHLDALLELEKLDAIQWTCVDGQPPPTAYVDVLRRIQAAGKRLVIVHPELSIIETLSRELSSKGLLLVTRTTDRLAAENLLKQVRLNTHE